MALTPPFPPALLQGQRIDYILCTPGLLDRVESCDILTSTDLPSTWSDHAGACMWEGVAY